MFRFMDGRITYRMAMNIRSQGPFRDPIANPFPRIYIGDGLRLTYAFMERNMLTHVINCADETACRIRLPPERYVCLNAIDSTEVQLFDTWYPEFKITMDRYLQDPTCRNVYVHCQAGINRSAFLAAGYIIKTFGIPIDRCVQKIIHQRPCALTNPAFADQLKLFAKNSS